MKKNLFIALSILMLLAFLTSCSLFNKSPLAPPAWIEGSWSDDYDVFTWEFTTDNVLYSSDDLDMDFKALALEPETEITDESTDDTYSFTYSAYSVTTDYSFEMVDDTTLNYSIDNSTPVVLHKD